MKVLLLRAPTERLPQVFAISPFLAFASVFMVLDLLISLVGLAPEAVIFPLKARRRIA